MTATDPASASPTATEPPTDTPSGSPTAAAWTATGVRGAAPTAATPGAEPGQPEAGAGRPPQPGLGSPTGTGTTGPGSPTGPGNGGGTAPATGTPVTVGGADLDTPRMKDIAQQLVSSAENSSLDWRAQYRYIEDIHDGRGYTGGIIGFTSGTSDMLQLVKRYQTLKPGNVLAPYIPALEKVNGSDSHAGLDPSFVGDWRKAAQDPAFQQAQNDGRDRVYFNPAVAQAKADGLHALGQFVYYDAIVMHGPGSDRLSFGGIRAAALGKAKPPSGGGDETAYLNAFLDARRAAMKADPSHQDTSRVDTVQRVFLKAGNLTLATPLRWTIYGDSYSITG
ncbi:chitosanase [Kitasatospora sp. NPDC048296]|uniref:chitosanase n=1 Tax=Kitasatospora sp. NPDC048296 TaxID=3364048 RepID=UPI0037248636